MVKTLTTDSKNKLPEIHPGDIVRVHQKITEGGKDRVQVFEGIVIKTKGKTSPSATFTVRKITYGVGVERTFPLHSPSVIKIEFKKGSKVRRSKLYYLRNLSGKALKMKEKKIDKDLWELVVQTEVKEPTEEMLEEAVQAAKEAEEETSVEEKQDKGESFKKKEPETKKEDKKETEEAKPEPTTQKDDKVEGEVKADGKQKNETQS